MVAGEVNAQQKANNPFGALYFLTSHRRETPRTPKAFYFLVGPVIPELNGVCRSFRVLVFPLNAWWLEVKMGLFSVLCYFFNAFIYFLGGDGIGTGDT